MQTRSSSASLLVSWFSEEEHLLHSPLVACRCLTNTPRAKPRFGTRALAPRAHRRRTQPGQEAPLHALLRCYGCTYRRALGNEGDGAPVQLSIHLLVRSAGGPGHL